MDIDITNFKDLEVIVGKDVHDIELWEFYWYLCCLEFKQELSDWLKS